MTSPIHRLLARQTPHKLVWPLDHVEAEMDDAGRYCIRDGDDIVWMDWDAIERKVLLRERLLKAADDDHYNSGHIFPSWDANLWEICRLRVENPGVPIEFMIGGSNGSAKTYFAAWFVVNAMMQVDKRCPYWCMALDEPNSESIQQKALFFWLPNEYKPDSGGVKTTGSQKLKYNSSGGFTDNKFTINRGVTMEFRFWSSDLSTVEGNRPYMVWSDEGIPLEWMDGVKRRLLTHSEPTAGSLMHGQWLDLLEQKRQDRGMMFPRDLLGRLAMGLHLNTFTVRDEPSATFRAFVDGGKVMRRVESDRELLPRRDKGGNILGGEYLPSLIYSAAPNRRVRFNYAWENPLGGNWAGMKQTFIHEKATRKRILWQGYGWQERTAESPMPNFNPQIHCRPLRWISRLGPDGKPSPVKGTWYCIVDPVASGGRTWFILWAFVYGEQCGNMSAGDIFIAHEYPQSTDYIPGLGDLGAWALPGGKNNVGVRGPAQKPMPGGFRWRADEIRRIERKLAHAQGLPYAEDPERMKFFVPFGNRIMDSRAANTETPNQSESKTLIEWMDDLGLEFIPAGRDSGAAQGQTRVLPGLQVINDHFDFDSDAASLDEATGWLEVDPLDGKGPKLRICEECTNTIEALQNLPGGGLNSPFDDPIDCLRYLLISEPYHAAESAWFIDTGRKYAA